MLTKFTEKRENSHAFGNKMCVIIELGNGFEDINTKRWKLVW